MIEVSPLAEYDMRRFEANYKACEDYMKPIRAELKRRRKTAKEGK